MELWPRDLTSNTTLSYVQPGWGTHGSVTKKQAKIESKSVGKAVTGQVVLLLEFVHGSKTPAKEAA